MNTLYINSRKYVYPSSWEEIDYQVFTQLPTTPVQEIPTKITGIPNSVLSLLSTQQSTLLADSLSFLSELPDFTNTKPPDEYNYTQLPASISVIPIGNFINLEALIAQPEVDFMAVSQNVYNRDFTNISCAVAFGTLNWLFAELINLKTQYKGLTDEKKEEELKGIKKLEAEFSSVWGWNELLINMGKELGINYYEAQKVSTGEVFNFLQKEKDKLYLEELRQANKSKVNDYKNINR